MMDFSNRLNVLRLDRSWKPGSASYFGYSDSSKTLTTVQQGASDSVVYETQVRESPSSAGPEGILQADIERAGTVALKEPFSSEPFSEADITECPLINGGFEAGLSHWVTLEGTEQLSRIDTYIGLAALVLSTTDSGTTQKVRVTPGKIYQLTGYGRSTSEKYSSFGMTFFNAAGSLLARSDVGTIQSTKWQDYFVVAIAPKNTAYVQVWTYQGFDHGLTLIDGLSLQQISPNNVPPRQVSQFSLVNAPLNPRHSLYSRWQPAAV